MWASVLDHLGSACGSPASCVTLDKGLNLSVPPRTVEPAEGLEST
jgi:hypothetical protein